MKSFEPAYNLNYHLFMSDGAINLGDTEVDGIYQLRDQSEYLGGFVATGVIAIAKTATPLLVY